MKYPKGNNCHQCAPGEWRHTPNMTGDYEFDASVIHAKAKRLKTDLMHHIKDGNVPNTIYDPRTAYRGYSGYHGDE